jgi:radical SAM superfamily enzyme YgiQ (UPF0313 family)
MRIELVYPAAEDSAFLRSRAMAILAGLTPREHGLTLRDEIVGRLDPGRDLDLGADLAAISVSTKTARRAYQLADAYRDHGVKVVLGGIHPTALPDEAARHADAVVVGEAEGLWERLLDDLRAGRLRPRYRHASPPDYGGGTGRPPRWSIFTSRRYAPIYPLQASRGCPYDCEFCSVTTFFGHRLRLRAVDALVAEIAALPRRWVIFTDDNIVAGGRRARQLFAALEPLGLTWFGQASLQGLQDTATVRAMAASGCKGLFVGFESVNSASLRGCGKDQNDPRRYREIVDRLQDHGIGVWASFVFGLDDDGPGTFERTLELAVGAKIFMALFAIQTPYPGTRLYWRLLQEGRLVDPTWWLHRQERDYPLFRPRRMTRRQLHEGWQWTWEQFYGASSIARRFVRTSSLASPFSLLAYLPLNLLQRGLTRRKILGGERFFRRDRCRDRRERRRDR